MSAMVCCLNQCKKDCLPGDDKYPLTTIETYSLLANYTQDPRNRLKDVGTAGDGVAFTNVDKPSTEGYSTLLSAGGYKENRKNFDKSNITCHRYNKENH
jgi:hypothetical protein